MVVRRHYSVRYGQPQQAGIYCRLALELGWRFGLTSVPPKAVPYFTGTYTMDTTRLQKFLGPDYEQVIRYTVEEALADSVRSEDQDCAAAEQVTARS